MSDLARRTIARNIRRLRLAKGWGQEAAGERLFEQSGIRWSKASWSAAERSAETGRSRGFNADEIAALAELFGVKPGELFEEFRCPNCKGEPPSGFICAACGAAGRSTNPRPTRQSQSPGALSSDGVASPPEYGTGP